MKKSVTSLSFRVYACLYRILPASIQHALGSSEIFGPLRNRLIRKHGKMRLEAGQVNWEDLVFTFNAPYRIFIQASTNGIENRICRLARSVLKPGDVAIDVGANYGFVSLVMAKSVAPNGRLFSFEINPNIAEVLSETMALNELAHIAQIIGLGAGPSSSGNIVTVDSAIQLDPSSAVRFMKVDTDGADYGVLQGAVRLMQQDHPVVVVEMLKNQDQIMQLLRACGYLHFIGQDNQPVVENRWPLNLIASLEPVTIPFKTPPTTL